MEQHKKLSGIEEYEPDLGESPHAYFKKALLFARTFYDDELNRIWSTRFNEVTPAFFFREYVWVVHTSGFSAKAVSKFFQKILKSYGPYPVLALESFDEVFDRVRPICNYRKKVESVHKTAGIILEGIGERGWESFRNESLSTPDLLMRLPHVGPVTCFHLARNVGMLEFVKPDLHLVRMANHWGYSDCTEMCESIQGKLDEDVPLGIIDLVLWYSSSSFGTTQIRNR